MYILSIDEMEINKILRKEQGMDYSLGLASSDSLPGEHLILVRGDGKLVPISRIADERMYSLQDFFEGIPFPSELRLIILKRFTAMNHEIFFPQNYQAARGAHKLLATSVLTHPTRFRRFTSNATDPQYLYSTLNSGTYLTTQNDQTFVNTGFGAVGRYALPLPVPASFVHDYTLPQGTQLRVGTVSPEFGQAGGGVEVMTITTVSGVTQNSQTRMPDY